MDTLLLGTALARGGATNTKSGTWLREMAIRAMPGTSMMSKMAFKKHEEALKAFGLVDDEGKPTWFNEQGKPDPLKMLDIAGARAAAIPVEKRAAYERGLFGAQGGGGFALLADPAVHEQILNLRKTRDSAEFRNRYGGFSEAYKDGSTMQQARTAMAEFNVVAADLGATVLPAVNRGLKDLKAVLEAIRNVLPSPGAAVIGARGMEGAAGGAVVGGLLAGPGGAITGGAIGGIGGIAAGYMEQQARENAEKLKHGEREYERPADRYQRRIQKVEDEQRAKTQAPVPPIHLNLNIDGRALASAVSEQQNSASQYTTDTPASNGTSLYGP
jgi:hypothetical protein